MKIVFYTPTLSLGGYEKVVVNYANAFCEKHQITILCGMAEGDMKKSICEKVNIVNLGVRAREFIPAVKNWLKYNDCDILYVPFATYTSMAVIAKKLSNSKAVIYGAQHGFEEKNNLSDKVIGKLVNKAEVLTAVSKAVAEYDADRLNIEKDRYYILDNPVFNSNELKNQEDNTEIIKNEVPFIVTAGRLAYDKHIEIPIKILAEVVKETNAELVILGDGPEKDNLIQLAKELGVQDLVHFKGYVKDPMEYIKDSAVYMQTSKIESFGNGVIEAFKCGVPAVVTDCGGPAELIENGKYGINIGKFDSSDVVKNGAEAVINILDGKIEFANMIDKANRYDAIKLEKQFVEPYYEYIKKNK